jgi:hypothetical protein
MADKFSAEDLGLNELIEKFEKLKSEVKTGTKTVEDAMNEMSKASNKYNDSLTDVNKRINDLTKHIVDYKQKQQDLKKEYEAGNKSQIEYNKELAEINHSIARAVNDRKAYINVIQSEEGSIKRAKAENAIWRRERNEMGKATKENKSILDQYNKKIDENSKIIGENVDKQSQYYLGINQTTDAIGQFSPAAGKATGAIKQVNSAFKILLANPIVALIAAIVAGLTALVSSLKRSEEGQNALAKAGAVLSSVFETIADIVTTLAEKIVKAFKDPQQAVKDLWEVIKTNIANRVIALGDTFVAFGQIAQNSMKLAGTAIANLFKKNKTDLGEFKEALFEATKDLAKAQVQLLTGIDADKIIDGFKALGAEIAEDARKTAMLADRQAKLDKQIRSNLVQEQKDRLTLAKIKNEIDDKDKNDANERIRLIDEENKLLDDILSRNLAIAQSKYEIKVAQNALHASTKAELDEEARLLADIYKIEADITNQRKEAIAKRLEAQREAAQESVNLLNYELQIYLETNKQKLQDFEKIYELQKAALDEQLETGLIKQNDYNLKLLELESQKNEAIRTQKLEQQKIDYENDLQLAQENMFAVLELERQGLEMKRQQEIEYAERIGADVEKINKKYADAEKEIDRAKTDAKLELASGFAGNLAAIFGEQTAIGKAAAVAETTINTYRSATAAYASLAPIPFVGPVLGVAAAGAAIANGLANVKRILDVKSGLPGDTSGEATIQTAATTVNTIPDTRLTAAPDIGEGIVSRNITAEVQDKISLQPTLVIDDVTSKQRNEYQQNITATE